MYDLEMRDFQSRIAQVHQQCIENYFLRGTFEVTEPSNEATTRAEELLKRWLSPEQITQYDREQTFDVHGSSSGKRFRIRKKGAFNIDELDASGIVMCTYCFLPQGGLPLGDVMLAQKISLETNEEAALKIAHTEPLRWRQVAGNDYDRGTILRFAGAEGAIASHWVTLGAVVIDDNTEVV